MSNHSAGPSSSSKDREPPPSRPLIPEAYLSVWTQKLLYTSLGILGQALKVTDFIGSRENGTLSGEKWLLFDFAYLATLAQLRIPGLDYKFSTVVLQVFVLWALNAVLFWGVDDGPLSGIISLDSIPELSVTSVLALIFGMLQKDSPRPGHHLLGEHSVRTSPLHTARINPDGHSLCIQSPEDGVYIPVLISNFKATGLRYSFTPFGYATDSRYSSSSESLDLDRNAIQTIQRQRTKYLKRLQTSSGVYGLDEKAGITRQLQPSESLIYIRLTRPGTIKLQRAFDSKKDGRVISPAEVQVAPCPRAEFADVGSIGDYRCAGEDPDARLFANVFGVPPLNLRWSKILNGRTEYSIDEISQDRRGGSRYPGGADGYDERGSNLRVPQELQFPLLISLDTPGDHQYVLEDITDSLGNLVVLGSGFTATDRVSMATKTSRSFQVLRRPAISFGDCGPENPTSILIGSDAHLGISGNITDSFDPGWEVVVKYQPPGGDYKGMRRLLPWEKTFQTEGSRRSIDVHVSAPGEYTILEAKGKRCPADIAEPNVCRVVERPYPTAEMTVNRLSDCSGDTGISALVSLQGTPPFQLWYRVQRNDEPPHERSTVFETDYQGEVLLEPAQPGRYVYTFFQLGDANYKKVELPGPKIEQVIPELPGAVILSGQAGPASKRRYINTCESGQIGLDVLLKGNPPWNVELRVSGLGAQHILPFFELGSAKEILEIPIPENFGGSFDVDIISVDDVRQCKQAVTTPGVTINVRNTKPAVGFVAENDQFGVTVLEQGRAKLALDLAGSSPWRIKYRRAEAKNMNLTIAVATNSMFIPTTDKGDYELLEVSDSFCSGSVIEGASKFRVDWIPRPSVKLAPQTFNHYIPHNGSYVLQPVCEGMDDYADLNIFGKPPFQLYYQISRGQGASARTPLFRPTLNSIATEARVQLHTTQSGRVFYEVDRIGDDFYPIKDKDMGASLAERLLFEQQVYQRPSARFKTRKTLTYQQGDTFMPSSSTSEDGTIVLEGHPPFHIQLSIKNTVTRQVDHLTAETSSHVWKPQLPSYTFKDAGLHSLTIETLVDGSNCLHSEINPSWRSILINVEPTASIIPADHRGYYCVGDTAHFHLEGSAPWMIGYRINSNGYTQETNSPTLSVPLDRAGEIALLSISHHNQARKLMLRNSRYPIHRLPSATVAHGQIVHEDIHDGDQAKIVFTLIGVPPFTFTYQRSEFNPKQRGKAGKVLETHTVSHVSENSFTIFASIEGTWTITSISDAYCHFPPT